MRGGRILAVTLAILLAAVALGHHFYKSESAGGPPGGMPVPVEMATVAPQPLRDEIQAVGTLYSNEAADIRPEAAGRIASIAFSEGQAVKKGDLLVQIDDSIAKAEVDKAAAALGLARLTYARTETLEKKGAISQQARDEAVAGLEGAQAAYELARVRLEKTAIRAPFDGIIGLRGVSEGDYVEPGRSITRLEMTDPMKVEFTVSERVLASVKPDLPVSISVEAYKGEAFEGRVFAVDPKIDPDTRTLRIKAVVSNSENKLRPGMFAYVALTVGDSADALLIPEESVIPQGKESFVYRAIDGKAVMTRIATGLRRGGKVQITEGLREGDVVITAGQMKLRPDAPVISAEEARKKIEAMQKQ